MQCLDFLEHLHHLSCGQVGRTQEMLRPESLQVERARHLLQLQLGLERFLMTIHADSTTQDELSCRYSGFLEKIVTVHLLAPALGPAAYP